MIRPAELKDVQWMAECHWDAYREHVGNKGLSENFSDYIQMATMDVLTRKVFVHDDCSGYVVVDTSSTEVVENYSAAWLKRSYIIPSKRGQGLYKELVAHVKGVLDCTVIQLLTEEEYKRVGGKKVGVVCNVQ